MSAERRDRGALRGLYAITPETSDTKRLVSAVESAVEGGARAVQYRAKMLATQLRHEQARAIAEVCRHARVAFIVNDSIDLAVSVNADGVHLGRDDAGIETARLRLGDAWVGVSCYDDPERARIAAAHGADYVGIGSVFSSATKPGAVRAPLSLLAEARRVSGLPVVAIGGITLQNAREAIDAGADMVAVISGLFDAPDVRATARAFARLFDERREDSHDVRAQPRAV